MDAALNMSVLYLEALLLLVIIAVYGIDNVLLDIRFMFKEHPRGILIYLKYCWIISFITVTSLILLKTVFLPRSFIGEIMITVFILFPLVLFAVYNSFRYMLQGVSYIILHENFSLCEFQQANFLFKPILATGPQNESFRMMRGSFLMTDSP